MPLKIIENIQKILSLNRVLYLLYTMRQKTSKKKKWGLFFYYLYQHHIISYDTIHLHAMYNIKRQYEN